MPLASPLSPEQLYKHSTLDGLPFATTQELPDLNEFIGQDRALSAIQFGVSIARQGYNIFALGESGTGKQFLVRQTIEGRAATEPPPFDWCYVNNFDEPHRPCALCLPPGKGKELRTDMARFVDDLQTGLTLAFESEDVQARRQHIAEEYRERQQSALEKLENKARKKGFSLLKTSAGVAFAPMRNGDMIAPEEMDKLPINEKNRIQQNIDSLQGELQKAMFKVPSWERELRKRIREVDQEVARLVIAEMIDDLFKKYAEFPEVIEYMQAVQKDIVEHLTDFVDVAEKPPSLPEGEEDALGELLDGNPQLRRYQVNVLVDASVSTGAPVIYENNPTYLNLLGRVEQMVQMGALITDFLLIKPGVLHRANGGYIILEAAKVLSNPYAWEGLKRSLQFRELRIETPIEMLNMSSTMSLDPEPVPLNVKVVLLGDPELYYTLAEEDPEFSELFKVAADFDNEVERTPEMEHLYARLLATIGRREGLRPFDRSAICRVIEESARVAGDAERLTTRMQHMVDLLQEADYWAAEDKAAMTASKHVQRAIDAQTHRTDRIPHRLRQEVLRNTVLIDTCGSKIGQINGLAVIGMGTATFGEPMRITATVGLGKGDVIDIEREVHLSGPTHSKGVLILSSFLRARYATEQPLSLSASLVFEQSYGGVDGDSASSTELYALLSAIAQLPIKQSLAVTGSVNQLGQVQAIGGVNEKIEGFFDLCLARGLTGDQGVLIPASNVKHLMLRQDIVAAVRSGKFSVYAAETIDQGIELLTGVPAGELQPDDSYPVGSVNRRVADRLSTLATALRRHENGNIEKL